MKRSLLAIIATAIMSVATVTSAADNPKLVLLKQLDQLQVITYETTTNLLSYTLEDNKNPYNATQYAADNKKASEEGGPLAAAIDASIAAQGIKNTQPIQPLWTAYNNILTNPQLPLVAPGGIIDTFNIQELAKARNALNAALETVRKEGLSDVPRINILASTQILKVKEIAMYYTARLSGTWVAVDSKFNMKDESQKVTTLFDDMQSEAENNQSQLKAVTDAKTDWQFLSPVLVSDKKIQVSAVISIYCSNIVKLLNQL